VSLTFEKLAQGDCLKTPTKIAVKIRKHQFSFQKIKAGNSNLLLFSASRFTPEVGINSSIDQQTKVYHIIQLPKEA